MSQSSQAAGRNVMMQRSQFQLLIVAVILQQPHTNLRQSKVTKFKLTVA